MGGLVEPGKELAKCGGVTMSGRNAVKSLPKRRKQITFDLSQKALRERYPNPNNSSNPTFYLKAYKDIARFMKNNGFEHRQFSVYNSTLPLTAHDVMRLMRKLAAAFPWLYACTNEIDVTDIRKQYSLKETLGAATNEMIDDIDIEEIEANMDATETDALLEVDTLLKNAIQARNTTRVREDRAARDICHDICI